MHFRSLPPALGCTAALLLSLGPTHGPAAGAQEAAPELRLAFAEEPALHGDRVVVAAAGGLLLADLAAVRDGRVVGTALPLPEGRAERPALDPTGRWLAFGLEQDDNVDVWIQPLDGSAPPRRLTAHPAADRCEGFGPDGRFVWFRAARQHPLGMPELYRVPVAGGQPERMAAGPVSAAAVDPGSGRVVIAFGSESALPFAGYRGGAAADLWVVDARRAAPERLTRSDVHEHDPTWLAGRVYFLTDASGRVGIGSVAPGGGPPEVHADLAVDSGFALHGLCADAAPGGTGLVAVAGGRLWSIDPARGQVEAIDVVMPADLRRQPAELPFLDHASAFALAPDGRRAAAAARGTLLEWGDDPAPRTVLAGDDGWIGSLAYAGDGALCFSTSNGREAALWREPPGGAAPVMLWSGAAAALAAFAVAPHGRRVARLDAAGGLFVLDLERGAEWAAHSAAAGAGAAGSPVFSPDGRLLAFEVNPVNGPARVVLHRVAERIGVPIGEGLHDESMPCFDSSGTLLFHWSSRGADEDGFGGTLRVVPLRPAAIPPLARFRDLALAPPRPPAAGADAAPAPPRSPVHSLDGFDVHEVNDGYVTALAATRDGLAFTVADGDEAPCSLCRSSFFGEADEELRFLPFFQDEAVVVGPAALAFRADPRARALLVLREDDTGTLRWFRCAPPLPGEAAAEEEVPAAAARIEVDPARENVRLLDHLLAVVRDRIYEAGRVDARLPVVEGRAREALQRVVTRRERDLLFEAVLAELGESHVAFASRGDATSAATGGGASRALRVQATRPALLGCDLAPDEAGLRVVHLPRPGAFGPAIARGPLDLPFAGVGEGARLLAVNGIEVSGEVDRIEALLDPAFERPRLEIVPAGGVAPLLLEIDPLDEAGNQDLRYADWVEANRRRVAERSGGRIGYVHVRAMDDEGRISFRWQALGQRDRAALLVDVRGNEGGSVSDELLARLRAEPFAFEAHRDGARLALPVSAWSGPMAVLVDGATYSDGEWFALLFRELGLGPVVGARTAGWLTGSDRVVLFDGSELTVPVIRGESPRSGALPEGRGVTPDVVVERTPEDAEAGRDPCLEMGVDVLARLLEK